MHKHQTAILHYVASQESWRRHCLIYSEGMMNDSSVKTKSHV